ncbi:MAG: hypothetical protein ABIW19_15520 [Vicinamibacterales bacterium]
MLAVALLNGLTVKTEARRISLSIPRPSLKGAQLADVVSAFYLGRVIAPLGGTGTNPEGMVGMPEGSVPSSEEASPLASAVLSKKTPEGAPAYNTVIARPLDTADDAILMRNMLLAQFDENASIVLAGPASGVARLLGLYGARPQIQAKCKQLVMAIGAYPTGAADPAVKADVAAARKLFADWPTAIVAVGSELGEVLPYPGASIQADFDWAPAHPVVDAYHAVKPGAYDAPASALAAVLYAVHPDDGYFKLSAPGTITVMDDGRTQFSPNPDGKHRYLIADPAQKDRVIKLYTEMVSAKPAPRAARGGRGAAAAQQQQQQRQQQAPPPQQPPAPKPPETKPPVE